MQDNILEWLTKDAFNDACRGYFATLTNLTGTVRWFDRQRGSGDIDIPSIGTSVPVHACNLKGKKTWYPETACVYLEEGQVVTVDRLADMGQAGVTAIVSDGIKFDSEKWDKLDQSRLAFKCNEAGEAINGLFASKEEKVS